MGKPFHPKPLMNTSAGQVRCSTHLGQALLAVGKAQQSLEAQLTPTREGQAAIVYASIGSSEKYGRERKSLAIAPQRRRTILRAGHRKSLRACDWRWNT